MIILYLFFTLSPHIAGFCGAAPWRHAEAAGEQHRVHHQHQDLALAQWGEWSILLCWNAANLLSNVQNTDLKSQMSLLGTNQDLYKEAVDGGRVTEDLNMKVAYSDIFISPWCCDSSHEDRYEALVKEMSMLELDPTTVVLLSVMSLFYISQQAQSAHLSASSSIASHQRKFSLLLQR